jgi:Bestrophin, RFP-TM, chloride channel
VPPLPTCQLDTHLSGECNTQVAFLRERKQPGGSTHQPLLAASVLARAVARLELKGPMYHDLNLVLQMYMRSCGACERIGRTPIPMPYSRCDAGAGQKFLRLAVHCMQGRLCVSLQACNVNMFDQNGCCACRHTTRFILFYVTFLPFALWKHLGWATLAVAPLITLLLSGIENIGVMIEVGFILLHLLLLWPPGFTRCLGPV